MSNIYTKENLAWRERLVALIRQLKDTDMDRAAGVSGWTVAGLLGHLAFWDRRASVLLARWQKVDIGPSQMDVDVVNEAMRPLLNALHSREAAELAVAAAVEIDNAIDTLDPTFLARVEKEGTPVRLNRGVHRQHHMEQIERALGKG